MRVDNWERELSRALERANKASFVYGETDCAMFSASVASAITGTDYAKPFRSAYYDREGAAAILKQGGGMVDVITKALNTSKRPAALASRGDLVLIYLDNGRAICGVCDGPDAVFMTLTGLRRIPIQRCSHSWPI